MSMKRTIMTAILGGGAFVGLNGLLTNLFLPFETTSVIGFAAFEIALVVVPCLLVLIPMLALQLGQGGALIGMLIALGARFLTSLTLESSRASTNQLLVEIAGIGIAVLILRIATRRESTTDLDRGR
jgi:hypothetical protein